MTAIHRLSLRYYLDNLCWISFRWMTRRWCGSGGGGNPSPGWENCGPPPGRGIFSYHLPLRSHKLLACLLIRPHTFYRAKKRQDRILVHILLVILSLALSFRLGYSARIPPETDILITKYKAE
jgi:hypothetical protein